MEPIITSVYINLGTPYRNLLYGFFYKKKQSAQIREVEEEK
jgi:hypothetical protein